MLISDIKNKIIVTSTSDVEFSELHDLIRRKKVTVSEGYSFTKWKDGIIHTNNFEHADALIFDFFDYTKKNIILDKLEEINVKYLIVDSRNNNVFKNGNHCERFHLILPLKSSITDSIEYKRIMKELNQSVFHSRAKEFLFTPESFLYYSRTQATCHLNEEKSLKYIDEINLQEELYKDKSKSFYPLHGVKFRRKLKRGDTVYTCFSFDDRNIEYIQFADMKTRIRDVTETAQRIICPFHNNEVAHEAEIRYIKGKIEVHCLEHNQIFTPNVEIVHSMEEELSESETYDLEDKGFTIGMLNDHDGTYFVFNKTTKDIDVYKDSAFKSVINAMYRCYFPKATMTGYSYFNKMRKYRKVYRIVQNPRSWEAEKHSKYESYINLSALIAFRVDSQLTKKILKYKTKYCWEKTMHKFMPSTTLLLQNIMGEGFKTSSLKFFLNWLVGVYVYREKAKSAIIFNGHPRNGIHILVNTILKSIFDKSNIEHVHIGRVMEKFNDFLVGNSVIFIEGIPRTEGESYQVVDKIENWVNNPIISVNKKLQAQYKTNNDSSIIWFSSRGLPSGFSRNDSTFSVFRGFTDLNSIKLGNRNVEEQEFTFNISKELHALVIFLKLWNFDELLFNRPYENEHRDVITNRSENLIWDTIELIIDPDFDYRNVRNTIDDANELQTLLVEAFSVIEPYIPLSLLTMLHNYLHHDLITVKKISIEIRNLLGISKTDRQRFGYDRRPTAGFYLKELVNGVKRARGKLNEQKRKSYSRVDSPEYRDSIPKKYTRNAIPQLTQDVEEYHKLFIERPLYQLKGGTTSASIGERNFDLEFNIVIHHREHNLITLGDMQRMKIHYVEYGDQDAEDFLPIEDTKYLEHYHINQLFSPGETDDLIEHIERLTSVSLVKKPASHVLIEDNHDTKNAVKFTFKLKDARRHWIADLDFTMYLYFPEVNLKDTNIKVPFLNQLCDDYRVGEVNVEKKNAFKISYAAPPFGDRRGGG